MDLIYGNTRKVLKIIYKNYQKGNTISKFDIPNLCKIPKNEVELILSDLHGNGYFGYTGGHGNFILTNKGLSYFTNARHKTINTLLTSVVFPIVVAFITSLITSILANLLAN